MQGGQMTFNISNCFTDILRFYKILISIIAYSCSSPWGYTPRRLPWRRSTWSSSTHHPSSVMDASRPRWTRTPSWEPSRRTGWRRNPLPRLLSLPPPPLPLHNLNIFLCWNKLVDTNYSFILLRIATFYFLLNTGVNNSWLFHFISNGFYNLHC